MSTFPSALPPLLLSAYHRTSAILALTVHLIMAPLLLFNSTNPKICLRWEAIQVAAKVSQSIAQHTVAAHDTTSPTSTEVT